MSHFVRAPLENSLYTVYICPFTEQGKGFFIYLSCGGGVIFFQLPSVKYRTTHRVTGSSQTLNCHFKAVRLWCICAF